jgi:hypothetical protein
MPLPMKRSLRNGRPIRTAGGILPDGTVIELIRDISGELQLLLVDGTHHVVGPCVVHAGKTYGPPALSPGLLREVMLPNGNASPLPARQLLSEICKLTTDVSGLSERNAALVGRTVLCSWVIEALGLAPTLVIAGPDISRANALLRLLYCLCRHSVRLTGISPARLCSLPSSFGFTLVIRQSRMSLKMRELLDDLSWRDHKIPYGGNFLDLFGVKIIHCESIPESVAGVHTSIEIPMLPSNPQPHVMDDTEYLRIATEFQRKLLAYRIANLRSLQFTI